mmetsp:Transcript_17012/g.22061  ORF Transcript_17012/g.22061 Transcript_17012/m.22061 type:complete len:337 (-) Transcript_17012:83-1093(-)
MPSAFVPYQRCSDECDDPFPQMPSEACREQQEAMFERSRGFDNNGGVGGGGHGDGVRVMISPPPVRRKGSFSKSLWNSSTYVPLQDDYNATIRSSQSCDAEHNEVENINDIKAERDRLRIENDELRQRLSEAESTIKELHMLVKNRGSCDLELGMSRTVSSTDTEVSSTINNVRRGTVIGQRSRQDRFGRTFLHLNSNDRVYTTSQLSNLMQKSCTLSDDEDDDDDEKYSSYFDCPINFQNIQATDSSNIPQFKFDSTAADSLKPVNVTKVNIQSDFGKDDLFESLSDDENGGNDKTISQTPLRGADFLSADTPRGFRIHDTTPTYDFDENHKGFL